MLLIFLGGGACGAAATAAFLAHSLHNVMLHPEAAAAHFTAHLTSALDLTETQREQVREIVNRRQQGLAGIHREIAPRVKVELAGLEQEVGAVLDEKQKTKWHGMTDRFRWMWLPPESPSEKR